MPPRSALCGKGPVLLAAVCLTAAPAAAGDRLAISVHYGIGTPRLFVVEGRVTEEQRVRSSSVSDSWLRNLWRNLRGLRAEEAAGVALRASLGGRTFHARSDGEGYFEVRAETPSGASPGWNTLRVETADGSARADTPLLIVPGENALGIISDFDDTLVVSEVPDRSRLARHALLENYLQREPVAGMAGLYRAAAARNPRPEATPVVYLTGSPRQIQPGIAAFLEHHGFPRGAIVARKITDGGGGDPLLDQQRYKIARIERLLADLAPVRFILSGDDGERDPEVYEAVRARHPNRVDAVWIRRVSPDAERARYAGQEPPPLGGTRTSSAREGTGR